MPSSPFFIDFYHWLWLITPWAQRWEVNLWRNNRWDCRWLQFSRNLQSRLHFEDHLETTSTTVTGHFSFFYIIIRTCSRDHSIPIRIPPRPLTVLFSRSLPHVLVCTMYERSNGAMLVACIKYSGQHFRSAKLIVQLFSRSRSPAQRRYNWLNFLADA